MKKNQTKKPVHDKGSLHIKRDRKITFENAVQKILRTIRRFKPDEQNTMISIIVGEIGLDRHKAFEINREIHISSSKEHEEFFKNNPEAQSFLKTRLTEKQNVTKNN